MINNSVVECQLPSVLASEVQLDKETECLTSSDHKLEPMSKGRILKNLFVLNFFYCLFYTGFWALTNLQSTMNAESGIGPDSQAVIYLFSMLSSLFLPELTTDRFGCKTVIIASTFICLPYIASNMYLRWDVFMISSALYGLGSGPFSAAQTIYIDELAVRFQGQVSENMEFVMACFFGVYTFFMENTQVWGNAVSSLVLQPEKHVHRNFSRKEACGIRFELSADGNTTNNNLIPPTENERIWLVGIYVFMGLLALLFWVILLDPLKNDIKAGNGCSTVTDRLKRSLKHFVTPHQLLLIPITIYIGIESAFYANDYTEAYIACSWGVHHVGFVTVCFGVCGALMSLLVGPLVKCVSQMAVLILAACANVSMCIVLFLWEPSPDFTPAYFIIAGVWGMGDAIWWSQVTALYGLMFPNDREAAFSNLYFWSFLGFFLSYSYANYFTVAVKINILLCFLVTGMIGYLIGQIKIKCTTTREYVSIPNGEEE